MADAPAVELCQLVLHEQVENAYWQALRMFVGRGKRHRAADVSTGAGIHRRTLDSYRGFPVGHPDHRPLDEGQKWSILSFIGADMTTVWLGLIEQGAYNLPDLEPDPGELAADTSEASAKVVRMAADRDLTNDDPHQLRETGTRMMGHGAQLVALGARVRRRA